ncbi:MAG: GvpL/GvpF family gas vesicle protein [Alphaproteobacteria bacterium]
MSFSWRTFLTEGRANSMRSRVASLAAAVVPAAAPMLSSTIARSQEAAVTPVPASASVPAPTVAAPEPETLIYLYGITRDDTMARSAVPLVEGVIPGLRVKVLSLGDFAILFNHVPKNAVPVSGGGLDTGDNSKDISRRHHHVLENLSLVCTVVPMQCCTTFPSMKAVVSQFANLSFHDALIRVAGTQEWCVRLFADMRKCCELAEGNPAITPLKADLVAAATPAQLSTARSNLCDAIDEEVCDRLALSAGDVHRRLGIIARAAKSNLPKGNGREVLDGNAPALILDAAYLIEKRDENAFHRLLAELNSALSADGLSLKFSGPWPPYSFAAADVEEPSEFVAAAE